LSRGDVNVQNSDRDDKASPGVIPQNLDLGFPDDEDDVNPEGEIMCC